MLCQGILSLVIVTAFFKFLRKEELKQYNKGEFEEAEALTAEKA